MYEEHLCVVALTSTERGTLTERVDGLCTERHIRAFDITGDWKTMALKAEVWIEAVTEGGRRFMAAWGE